MQIADLLIHVNQPLGASDRASIEDGMRGLGGVIAPRFNRETPQLLLVCYDPTVVRSRDLLDQVKGRGYNAQLVGM